MMKYYLYEASRNIGGSMTAGVKARCDVEAILEAEGYARITILPAKHPTDSTMNKIKASSEIGRQWQTLAKELNAGDVLVIQLPLSEHTLQFGAIVADLRRKGVKTVAVVHDLEKLRNMKVHNTIRAWKGHIRNFLEETWALKNFSKIVVHNESMRRLMEKMGYSKEQLVSLVLFDYLLPEKVGAEKVGNPDGVIIAGNLRQDKAGYAYHLPADECVKFSLYGVNYTGTTEGNIGYYGAFDPDVLPFVLNGKYGLVWDGPRADTCGGIHGEYLRINNPHKTSLYLASGFPVIIWKEAALADFVQNNRVGICVSSLEELSGAIAEVDDAAYAVMLRNVKTVSEKLRNGCYLKTALKKCGLD